MSQHSAFVLIIVSALLSACGGGGGGSSEDPQTPVVNEPDVSLTLVESQAYELNGQIAKFKIARASVA